MLSALNTAFEGGAPLPDDVWDQWVWGSDLHEPPTAAVALNCNHLLGLLVARHKARSEPRLMRVRLMELFPAVVHGSIMVRDMTLRQLRDACEDVQMHWAEYTGTDWELASQAVDALMTRFGELNLAPGHPALRDDPASLDPDRPGWIAIPSLRRFLALFCVLYRHIHLESAATDLQPAVLDMAVVQNHHIQAGMEEFYRHGMLADLPPAARITYKLDFHGMYHCVTQVVYMHYPSYERRRQITLEEMRAPGTPAVHALSVVLQLSPETRVVYEDDTLAEGWNWVFLAGGRLYLVELHTHEGARALRVLACPCTWTLLARTDDTLVLQTDSMNCT